MDFAGTVYPLFLLHWPDGRHSYNHDARDVYDMLDGDYAVFLAPYDPDKAVEAVNRRLQEMIYSEE